MNKISINSSEFEEYLLENDLPYFYAVVKTIDNQDMKHYFIKINDNRIARFNFIIDGDGVRFINGDTISDADIYDLMSEDIYLMLYEEDSLEAMGFRVMHVESHLNPGSRENMIRKSVIKQLKSIEE